MFIVPNKYSFFNISNIILLSFFGVAFTTKSFEENVGKEKISLSKQRILLQL